MVTSPQQLRVDVITRFAHFEILEVFMHFFERRWKFVNRELLGRYAATLGRSSVFDYEALRLDRYVLWVFWVKVRHEVSKQLFWRTRTMN